MARPTKFRPEFVVQAEKLSELGATDMEMADFFGVDVRTLYRWKHDYEAFCQAVTCGKDVADERVERSFYNRCVGYSFDAVKIFMPANAQAPVHAPYVEHVPPDPGAAFNWLKNRRPDKWRDKKDVEHSGELGIREVRRTVVDPEHPHGEGVPPATGAGTR